VTVTVPPVVAVAILLVATVYLLRDRIPRKKGKRK
jgi:uncharacterized membrane protein (DUF2068 family)